ncbi:hypothetical protein HII36_16500 [Nonomuraea sp. NN258]|uniref:hypothetical protein n=1 Tax=Nonomuraea antri TaxID=2730852 RepID=UPI001568CDA8|nr:hypothetical protein [Nonomuraea antri]NRQ33435.1 hypothetical protein [Nonomuraea antri]
MHSREPHDPLALTVVSSHVTSEGVVSYLRCACGAWEVRTASLVGSTSRATAAPR